MLKKIDNRNETQQQKSHEKNKHQSSYPRKILGTLLKMDKGRIQTDELKNKEIDDEMHKVLHSRGDISRLYMSRKSRRGFVCIDYVDATILRTRVIKKTIKERPITAVNNNNINRNKFTRKKENDKI